MHTILGETQNQFSLTRTALGTGGRAKSKFLSAIAFRWSIAAVFALWVFAARAPAQPVQAAKPASMSGVYNGSYTGAQGTIKFKLSVTQQDNGTLAGSFTLYLPDVSDTKPYTCNIRGRYFPANRMVQLTRGRWETAPPAGVDMLGMNGFFDPTGGNGAGQIAGRLRGRPASQFEAVRDVDESAKFAGVTAAKQPAAAPATGVARQVPEPVAARTAAPRAPSPPAPAAPAATGPTAINGVYTGEFRRSDGNLKLKLSIKSTDDGSLTALFTFDPPANKGSSITYKLTGEYVAKSHAYGLASSPFEFTTIEPVGSGAQDAQAASKATAVHIGITGPGAIYGSMTGSNPGSGEFHIGWISATIDRAQSADLDKAMLSQGSGTSTAVPVAPVVHPSFEGVYNGTYADKKGPIKFKLTLWLQRENRAAAGQLVSSDIGGLLTLYLPDASGSTAYTSVLKGFYAATSRALQVTSGRWEPPAPVGLRMAGLQGQFDPDGGNNATQISGFMADLSNSKFEAIRDADESAGLDIEHLRNPVRPGIEGVFNGTYTRASGPPTKFKLTITHNYDGPSGLAGMATIYLPINAGTKAYTYDLIGVDTGRDTFQLRVHDWDSIPPRDFQEFRSMGFKGMVVVDLVKNTARIGSVPAAGSVASEFIPEFEATWDATESADIKGAIAAQQAVGNADQIAAMKARDQTMKDAPPKQLPSTDLVHKSRAYWDGYQTDMLREVFDGGFGAAIDEDQLFEKLFCTYVESYSDRYAALLPAGHQTVTITEKTNRKFDQFGNLVSEGVRTATVEMDARFVDKYRQFYAALTSKGEGLRGALAAMQPGGAQRMMNDLMALARDIQMFFANHDAKSAAMRQLNENFLRAINGEPSLQQADGKIDGAQAESDKDLPPGRYARFVDGANAYFRERAKDNPTKFGNSSSHDTALCQRLAELYQSGMSREEDYYYANDFAGRFLPIMGSRASCPDPAWPQLHPAVEQAIAEIK